MEIELLVLYFYHSYSYCNFSSLFGPTILMVKVVKMVKISISIKKFHSCPQQTFRFIKNGHLQFFVFQKVWYIGVTKSVKLKIFFVRFLFYGYWKFVMSQRWKNTQKLMKIEKLFNETVWKRWKSSEFYI